MTQAIMPATIDAVYTTLENGTLSQVEEKLLPLHPAEIASVIESLPKKERELVWSIDWLPHSEVLSYLGEAVQAEMVQTMPPIAVAAAAEAMDTDDAVDLLQNLPEKRINAVLQVMDAEQRQTLSQVMSYPEDSAGGLMNTDVFSVRADVSLSVVLRYIRLKGYLPDKTDVLMVVDRQNRYRGVLPLADLLVHPPETAIISIMDDYIEPIPADMSAHDVAMLFEKLDLLSAPVIDSNGELLGRITVDDIVDVIRAEADHDVMRRAGLDEEGDMFASIFTTSRHRAVWLGINLFTALLAAWVIGLFTHTIDQVVALAVLMPVVASMGGIAGSQTLTVMIRGMALGQVTQSNTPNLLRKELAVGFLNGFLWAVVIAGIAIIWFGNYQIGLIIAVAIVINLLCAALSGIVIPPLLARLSIDPALAGGVILTTVTDIIGFAAFLGLATLLLLQ